MTRVAAPIVACRYHPRGDEVFRAFLLLHRILSLLANVFAERQSTTKSAMRISAPGGDGEADNHRKPKVMLGRYLKFKMIGRTKLRRQMAAMKENCKLMARKAQCVRHHETSQAPEIA